MCSLDRKKIAATKNLARKDFTGQWVVGGDTQGHHRRVSCHTPSTPPTGWERMLTGADGSMTPLESATTPPGKLWGVAVAVGARLVPIGAMRHVAGVWPGPAFLRLAQGHTICENTPFSGLPTVVDKRFAGGGRAHGVAALGALGSTFGRGSHVVTCTSH